MQSRKAFAIFAQIEGSNPQFLQVSSIRFGRARWTAKQLSRSYPGVFFTKDYHMTATTDGKGMTAIADANAERFHPNATIEVPFSTPRTHKVPPYNKLGPDWMSFVNDYNEKRQRRSING